MLFLFLAAHRELMSERLFTLDKTRRKACVSLEPRRAVLFTCQKQSQACPFHLVINPHQAKVSWTIKAPATRAWKLRSLTGQLSLYDVARGLCRQLCDAPALQVSHSLERSYIAQLFHGP